MVARKLSSYDGGMPMENFYKQRPSVYIDPDSDIFEGLQYLQNLEKDKCVNCIQFRSSSSGEGIKKLIEFLLRVNMSTELDGTNLLL